MSFEQTSEKIGGVLMREIGPALYTQSIVADDGTNITVNGGTIHNGGVSFSGTIAPVATPLVVTGAKGGNAALASLITALASLGLITDNTT